MTDARRRNWPLWAGFFLVLAAVLTSAVPFVKAFPGQQALPWLTLLISVLPFVLIVAGLRRAMAQPQVYRGKAAGWTLAAVSLLVLVFGVFGFYESRHIPAASGAPQVGQKAPEFTLQDISGRQVSLSQLLGEPLQTSRTAPPKAVLLVFYRGYW